MIRSIGTQNMQQSYAVPQRQESTAAAATKYTAEAGNVKKTMGEETLSRKAQDYLDSLRKTRGDLEFFVADYNQGDTVKDVLSRSTKEFSVIFSNEEIERMATDEKYAAERLRAVDGAVRMSAKINEQYGENRGFGKHTEDAVISKLAISVNDDGTTTFFAELEKSSKAQQERMEAAKEKRAEEKKAAEKKTADQKAEQEPVKRTIVTASSRKELLEKINAVDWSKIKEEPMEAGSLFDFSV